ncbi:MAG: hypothetical protein JJU31_10775 [Wenzhouxiangella sp.]|nr:hypothetical protein [Wenzhouxiangella sp.]TVR90739.1 MAG: hypothetical protein EA418_14650 [Wenzhouxiangellaceae bacterium]
MFRFADWQPGLLRLVPGAALKPAWWVAPWRQLPKALVPGLALAASGLTVLAHALPGPLGLLAATALLLYLWAVLYHHASWLLLAQSASHAGVGVDELAVPPLVGARHVALWVLVMLLLLTWQAGDKPLLLLAGGLFLCLLLPAATLVLTQVGSLADALYPPAWTTAMKAVGRRHYLVLSGCLLGLALGYLFLDLLFQHASAWLRNGVVMAWWAYAVLAWFALLGVTAAPPRPALPRAAPSTADAVAIDARFGRLQRHGGSNLEHRLLFAALLQNKDHDRLKKLAGRWLPALMEGFHRPEEAVERCDQLLSAVPDFSLETPSAMLALIKASEKHGYPDLTARLCHNFLHAFPVAPKRQTVEAILSRL